MQDDGNEDVEEDGDQIRQPIVILDQLPICKDQMVGQIPTTQFPGKGLRVSGGGGGGGFQHAAWMRPPGRWSQREFTTVPVAAGLEKRALA